MATPCSVNAKGILSFLLLCCKCVDVVTNCDHIFCHSAAVSWNINSLEKRSILRFTAWLNALVSVSYNSHCHPTGLRKYGSIAQVIGAGGYLFDNAVARSVVIVTNISGYRGTRFSNASYFAVYRKILIILFNRKSLLHPFHSVTSLINK